MFEDEEDYEFYESILPTNETRAHRGDIYQDTDNSQIKKMLENASMWAVHGDSFTPCASSTKALQEGYYTIDVSQDVGIYFKKITINNDDLLELPDSSSDFIVKNVESFWKKEEKFRELGFLWKRGILMWGPPGSGKTSTLHLVAKRVVDLKGLVIYVNNPLIAAGGLAILRKIEPKRPIVVILEDIDAIAQQFGESNLLALLDGELQIDNVIFIATTNYPERLDKRLINRPSRFDIIKKIGMPNEESRRLYLTKKHPRFNKELSKDLEKELKLWLEYSKEFSMAHLKELIILTEIFDTPLKEACDRLKAMMACRSTSEDFGAKIGFVQ